MNSRDPLLPDPPDPWSCGERGPHWRAGVVLRVLGWLAAMAAAVTGIAVIMPTLASGDGVPIDLAVLGTGVSALAAGLFHVAKALVERRRWARAAGIGCALCALAGFPLGTLVGGYLLWQLVHEWRPGVVETLDA